MRWSRILGMSLACIACLLALFFAFDIQPTHESLIFNSVIDNYYIDTGAQNSVTSIYLNYRIFDTVFEALMLLVSVMGVVHFSRHGDDKLSGEQNIILQKVSGKTVKNMISLVVPTIILLGLYLIINGHNTPGGGFQGGAALSAAFICVYLVRPDKSINFYAYEKAEKYIFLLIVAVATSFAVSGLYLNFPQFNTAYMVIMNILIGLKVFCGLTIIFYRFVHYEDI